MRGQATAAKLRTDQLNNRQVSEPTLRGATVGLRVCASYPAR